MGRIFSEGKLKDKKACGVQVSLLIKREESFGCAQDLRIAEGDLVALVYQANPLIKKIMVQTTGMLVFI